MSSFFGFYLTNGSKRCILKEKGAISMTRYEQITSMTQGQLGDFLFWFSLLQLPIEVLNKCNLKKFAKDIDEFLAKEIDFDEYDNRKIII